jgi:glycosyltransferase involved in cell wall biosynthesis
MNLGEPDLVTVVIPAYNAARTIDETLRSVRCQTHSRLEILVVDDGSEDETPQIARRHAAEDRRVRLIRQPHSGVAAARNRGIAEAAGDFVSPIDADDLWRPRNLEKQLAALRQSGDGVALVYNWWARIDADSRIIYATPGPTYTGTVLNEIFRGNFAGNGSTVLMRKQAIVEAGGYDPSLRARSGEGSEDWQLCFRIATRHQFAVVPEHLTGYRRTDSNMSANLLQMLRGRDLLAEEMCRRFPEHATKIKGYRLYFLEYLYCQALQARQTINALRILVLLVNENMLRGAAQVILLPLRLARLARRRLMRLIRSGVHWANPAESRRFLDECVHQRFDLTDDPIS